MATCDSTIPPPTVRNSTSVCDTLAAVAELEAVIKARAKRMGEHGQPWLERILPVVGRLCQERDAHALRLMAEDYRRSD